MIEGAMRHGREVDCNFREEKKRAIRVSISNEKSRIETVAEDVGLPVRKVDTRKQQTALAAATTALLYPDEEENIREQANISPSTIRKYKNRLSDPEMGDADPFENIFTMDDDAEFVKYIENRKTPLSCKTMKCMVEKYTEIMQRDKDSSLALWEINPSGVRQHIYRIIRARKWKMVKPVTVELKRCCILKQVEEWLFADTDVRNTLTSVDPHSYLTLTRQTSARGSERWRRLF